MHLKISTVDPHEMDRVRRALCTRVLDILENACLTEAYHKLEVSLEVTAVASQHENDAEWGQPVVFFLHIPDRAGWGKRLSFAVFVKGKREPEQVLAKCRDLNDEEINDRTQRLETVLSHVVGRALDAITDPSRRSQ